MNLPYLRVPTPVSATQNKFRHETPFAPICRLQNAENSFEFISRICIYVEGDKENDKMKHVNT